MENFSKLDLGSTLLSVAVIVGFFGFVLVIIRSIELPIRIYLDKKRKKAESQNDSESNGSEDKKGF